MTRSRWQSCPVCIIPRPRCPYCGTVRPPIIVRSLAGGDGSTTRHCICRDCSQDYCIVLEIDIEPEVVVPVAGSADRSTK